MNEYYKTLPTKRMGAGALIFNDKNELLVVKPTYKNYWSIPGGVVSQDESPRSACMREIREEIGIDIAALDFVCVDYMSAESEKEKGENLQFIFYGGILNKDAIQNIQLEAKELGEYAFVSIDRAMTMFGKNMAARLPKCIEAIRNKAGIYLERGK